MTSTAGARQKVAIVTGAGGGIGGAISRALIADGIAVAGVDLSSDGLKILQNEFEGAFVAIGADVAEESACRAAIDATLSRSGRLDILINCAGITGLPNSGGVYSRFWEGDMARWRRVQAINHFGAFQMAALAAPSMIAQGWGRMVNVSTSLATMLAPGLSAYGPSKAAMEASAAIWAKELGGTGVTVNAVLPGGPVATGSVPADFPRQDLLDAAIMGPPISWLVSDDAEGMTGMRFIARDWNDSLPPHLAAAACATPAGWPV